MFGPYRTPPQPPLVDGQHAPREEIILGWALAVLGGVRVIIAVATAELWETEATLALLMIATGSYLLWRR